MRRKRRLKTLDDLRRWMADVGNKLESGEIDVIHARCFAYLASVMAGIIKGGDLEVRLEALERTIKQQGNEYEKNL